MRVAVCLSGQPRRALDTYPYIYENIILPNHADVFIHMHYDPLNLYMEKGHMDNGACTLEKGIDQKLIDLYQPIRHLIEPPRNFTKPNMEVPRPRLENYQKMNRDKHMTDDAMKKHMLKQLTSMYYSIYKCNEMKELYANEQGIVYDYVIRLRFDFLPRQPLHCHLLDPHYIHYLELGQKDELISDWFNIGSNTVMNVYSALYLHMDYLNTFTYYTKDARLENTLEPSDTCGGLNEHMLRDLMTLFRIPKRPLHMQAELIV